MFRFINAAQCESTCCPSELHHAGENCDKTRDTGPLNRRIVLARRGVRGYSAMLAMIALPDTAIDSQR